EVVAVLEPEIRLLRGIAAARADVAALRRHRPEALEEVIDGIAEETERPAAPVVEDRRRPGLPADRGQPLGREVERLRPRARLERAVAPDERRREPLLRVLQPEEVMGPVAEEPSRDRVL